MNINFLKILVKLAENECDFSIHKELGISRSTLWTIIDEIEKGLGVKLVFRRKQHNTLTDEAKSFIPYAIRIIQNLEEGLEATQISNEPLGEIIIATTPAIANTFLAPSIKKFHDHYPKVRLKIIAGDHISSSTEYAADVVFRPIDEKEFLTRKWCITYHSALFASQEYLNKYGTPQKGTDLLDHAILGYGEYPFSYYPDIDWHLKGRWADLPRLKAKMTINSTVSLYIAASRGLGICSASMESNIFYAGNLVKILPHIDGPIIKTHFCIKKDISSNLQRNIQIFASFFEDYLKNLGVYLEYAE